MNRSSPTCVLCPAPGVVLSKALSHLGRHPGVISAVSAFEQVARPTLRQPHERPFGSPAGARSLPSTSLRARRVIFPGRKNHGASDGIRTHDTCLGKSARLLLSTAKSTTYPRCSALVRALQRPPRDYHALRMHRHRALVSAKLEVARNT